MTTTTPSLRLERLDELAPGSVVAAVGRDVAAWVPIQPEVTAVTVEWRGPAQPDELLVGPNDDFNERVLIPLQWRLFGKSVASPQRHVQIDVLLVAGDAPPALVAALLQYLHPAGLVIGERELSMPAPQQRLNGRFVYQPGRPVEEIPFAKMTFDERNWLASQARALPSGSIYVEVGAYNGGSAVIASLANPAIRIYAIDIWLQPTDRHGPEELWGDLGKFRRNTQFCDNVIEIRIDPAQPASALDAIAAHEGRLVGELAFDFVFVDGDHSYEGVSTDLAIYEPLARGVLCGHDYLQLPEVHRAVDNFFARGAKRALTSWLPSQFWHTPLARLAKPAQVETLPGRNTIWVVRRDR